MFVEFDKDAIRRTANEELNEMNEMVKTYKEENAKHLQAYETNLGNMLYDNVENAQLVELLKPNTPSEAAIEAEVSAKRALLMMEGDSSAVTKMTERYKLVFDNWNRFKMPQNVRAFEDDRERLYRSLKKNMEGTRRKSM